MGALTLSTARRLAPSCTTRSGTFARCTACSSLAASCTTSSGWSRTLASVRATAAPSRLATRRSASWYGGRAYWSQAPSLQACWSGRRPLPRLASSFSSRTTQARWARSCSSTKPTRFTSRLPTPSSGSRSMGSCPSASARCSLASAPTGSRPSKRTSRTSSASRGSLSLASPSEQGCRLLRLLRQEYLSKSARALRLLPNSL
mmetsp:Transcript_112562/g.363578  ORF Transcript_112562/g.363578 Transcript_112562/m.363578 type:complete len:203 (-) Transcript_112562:19-627(-)